VRIEDEDLVLTSEDRRPFAQRTLPALPSGIRVGQAQIRVNRRALGQAWLVGIEALLRLLSREREAVPA
jgi:hypothetical protein